MATKLSSSIRSLNAAAMGDSAADLLLVNCTLVNVYTGELLPGTEIAIVRDRIAYVGPDASHTAAGSPDTARMDLAGRYVTPGFADPHTHIDWFVLPPELAKRSLLCGVTSLFSDPIDTVSVAGVAGFREFLGICRGLPIRIFNMVPGGLPVDPRFGHTRSLTPAQAGSAARNPDVPGLGEVFSWTRVTARDPATMGVLAAMLEAGRTINGHTAGASGKKLNAYVASGILSCHEPTDIDQVLERLRLGMWIMIREGSVRRDLAGIIPEVLARKVPTDRLMFCSDGLDPPDMERYGHIDHCVRESVRLGVDPADAVAMASKNCFDYYNMGKDLGGIAPGKLADILVFDDLKQFRPSEVFVGGRLVVAGGRLVAEIRQKRISKRMRGTVRLAKLSEGDFAVASDDMDTVTANTITLLTEIITEPGTAELETRDGNVPPAPDRDVYKVAAFDRTGRTGGRTVGFLSGLGAPEIGAFASTWNFHENDLLVVGSNERDMAAAANATIRSGGGMAVVTGGRTLALLPMRFGGIASTGTFEAVGKSLGDINAAIVDAGCRFGRPHLIPVFLPFLALPSVRILHSGIVDVRRRSLVPAIADHKTGGNTGR